MPYSTISRDPQTNTRTRRAFDQLRLLLQTASVTLDSSVTQAGNTAATETTLFSYTLPVNELSNTDTLAFEACGTFAATASTDKRIKATFGSTTIFDTGNLNIVASASWSLRGSVTRSGAAAQKCDVTITTSSATLTTTTTYTASTESLDSTVILRIKGSGTNASDVVGQRFKALKLPG